MQTAAYMRSCLIKTTYISSKIPLDIDQNKSNLARQKLKQYIQAVSSYFQTNSLFQASMAIGSRFVMIKEKTIQQMTTYLFAVWETL